MRQNKFRHAHSACSLQEPRVENLDRWRRHCLGSSGRGWSLTSDKSRGGLFRRSGVGRSRRRAHQRLHLWRTPRDDAAIDSPGIQLDFWRLYRRNNGFRNDGRGSRHDWQSPPRPHGNAAILRLSHGRLLPPLDLHAALAQRDTAYLSRNWFRKDKTAISFGRASARTCACSNGSWIARAGARLARDADRLGATLRRHGMGRPGFPERDSSKNSKHSSATPGAKKSSVTRSSSSTLHDHLPKEMIYERELLICRI